MIEKSDKYSIEIRRLGEWSVSEISLKKNHNTGRSC